MIAEAQLVRGRDKFGPVSAEELAAMPDERELFVPISPERSVHVFELRPDSLPAKAALILNFHGGGFIKGRTDRDRRYACWLMQTLGCMVWDVDYCLAPEEPFPAAANDAYELAAYVFGHAEELGVDERRVAFAGHSAGGNLVASLCIRDAGPKRLHPCAALMEYFPADQTIDPAERLSDELRADPFWVKRAQTEKLYTDFYVGSADPADPLCSPLFASKQALASFPPSLVISAGRDSLLNDTERFAQRLLDAGVTVTAKRVPEAVHGFTVNRTPGWEQALALHEKFFRCFLSD